MCLDSRKNKQLVDSCTYTLCVNFSFGREVDNIEIRLKVYVLYIYRRLRRRTNLSEQ